MTGYLESLTVIVSPSFSKKTQLQNRTFVTIKSGNLWYPALICINKKLKVDRILCENGCIPESLERDTFSVESGCSWLFAKALTFSCEMLCEENSLLWPQTRKLDETTKGFSLLDLSSVSNFCSFLKGELTQNSPLCLRTGMKIRLRYLTQTFFLTVENIIPSFYELSDAICDKISFKCFKDTQIDINKHKTSQSIVGLDFEGFGGYEAQLEDLKAIVHKFFEGTKTSISGILISGMSGVGKTFIGSILQSVYGDKCRILSSEDIISSYKRESELTLKLEFQKASARAPSIIFIDNIDEICSSRDHDTHTAGIVNALLYLMDGVHSGQPKEVLVIATAIQPDTLDQALRRPGRLSHDVNFPVPNERDRLSILQCLLKEVPSFLINRELLSTIASKTSGFVAMDLLNLVTESFAQTDEETVPSIDHFETALTIVKPSSLKNVATLLRNVSSEEILGYQTLRSVLLTTFELSLRRRELFLAGGITTPSRILIFGPPGCGKSMVVYGLATRFNLALISVRRSNIFGKYFGESEKNLDALFHQAQKSSPCILHFENFDGIAGRRQKNAEVSNDVEDRVINHLKVMLDGVVGYENIFVVAETNRPDLLDKDVIRHGRFHKYFYFALPSPEDRRLVFERELPNCTNLLGKTTDFQTYVDSLVARTEGFSVAEILLLCKEINSGLGDANRTDNLTTETSGSLWRNSAVEEAFESVSPRTSSKMMKQYCRFSSLYCQKI